MSEGFQYWRVASGAFGRDYAKDFIRYGMAFVGGDAKVAAMATVNVNDRILMKRGISEVVAVGKVVERDGEHRGQDDKEWLRDFDGWDLRAYCFVEWHVPEEPIKTKGLGRGTIQRVRKQHLRDLAEEVLTTVPACRTAAPEPGPTRPVEDLEILGFLIRQGLRPGAAEDLTTTFNRVRLLARYYYDQHNWPDVREHETRTFLVIPLLLALGWAEQQIKIELPLTGRKRADVACFPRPFAKGLDDKCVLIVETKGFSQGLDYAQDQAKEYAEHFPNCRVVAVTNGYCYKAFTREANGMFPVVPSAYLNLLKPRDKYPVNPDVEGCMEALRLLLPGTFA